MFFHLANYSCSRCLTVATRRLHSRTPPRVFRPASWSMRYERMPRFTRLTLRWPRQLVLLHCNRKTDGCGRGRVMKRACWAVPGSGGFAPAPPGFSALLPLPMRGLSQEGKRDAVISQLDRSRPLSRRKKDWRHEPIGAVFTFVQMRATRYFMGCANPVSGESYSQFWR